MKIILLIIGIIVLIIGILSLSWAITNFMTYHHVVDASSDQYRRWKQQSKYYFIKTENTEYYFKSSYFFKTTLDFIAFLQYFI